MRTYPVALQGRSRAPPAATTPRPPDFAPLRKFGRAPHTGASYTVRTASASSIQRYGMHHAAARGRGGKQQFRFRPRDPPGAVFLGSSGTWEKVPQGTLGDPRVGGYSGWDP